MMDIEVRVPATVANLGPGFDCLGVALATYLHLRAARSAVPEIAGKGRLRPPSENLTYQAFVVAFSAAGEEAPPMRFEALELYPSGRGMGASASAIVAGLVIARQVGDLKLSDADIARLAVRIEGHADNVLPALFGGLVLASREGWMRLEPAPTIAPVILVSGKALKTTEARAVLPAEVPRADAVANAAATAALVAVVTGQEDPAALLMATADRLHERYRLPLMPETLDLHQALRAEGIAAALAGAGPSLVCLVEAERVEESVGLARELAPEGWQVLTPGWELVGAQVR